ncbi:uncharacterized protein LOC117648390, partial [Thrips palmi]|uniref:Uncharacterized protein LOC117648390 n=1 Tax=Thrips palmi TaxID=161013 RepID=A0A6P8Z8I7_THRPL
RYWSAVLRHCVECTHCAGPGREVTVRPCDGVRDAQCGSIRDLDIDWEWVRDRGVGSGSAGLGKVKGTPGLHERINSLSEAEAQLRDELRHLPPPQHPQHHAVSDRTDRLVDFGDDYILPDHPRQPQPKKEKKHRRKKVPHHRPAPKPFGDYDDFGDFGASGDAHVDMSDDEDLAMASWSRLHHHGRASSTPSPSTTPTPTTTTARPTTSAVNLVEDFIVEKEVEEALRHVPHIDVVATTQTFSTAETLVWDWQAGVLVAAVCACLLFFIVAAAYSCQHALHFKKLKKHLDADMEEISTRLALMAAMGSENLQDGGAGASSAEKADMAFPVRRGDHLRAGRQQNEYCLAAMPTKTRV